MRVMCHNPSCNGKRNRNQIKIDVAGDFEIHGVLQCLDCGNVQSIVAKQIYLVELATIVGQLSNKLNNNVPKDITEDIQESERTHYAQCYKSCVAICRRSLQIALIEKGIKDLALSVMMKEALEHKLITIDTYNLAKTIKTYGDVGVHRREVIDAEKARLSIYIAVELLNELFK